LTKPAECQALVDLALLTYGRIDVLFNNAAITYFNWLEDITDEEWSRDLREEVDLVFFLTRAAWPHLKASHGVVVNTAALNGLLSFKTPLCFSQAFVAGNSHETVRLLVDICSCA
jgi:NAD(P)-dependent dehydrogenase (short-subunit alcohol dehydrogenase family)